MGKRLKKYIFYFLLLCISFSNLLFEHINLSTAETTLPQGVQGAIVYDIKISPKGIPSSNSEYWESLTLRNTGTTTLNQLTFYFYLDKNKNQALDNNDTLVDPNDLIYTSSGQYLTINNIHQQISEGSTYNYFVVLNIASTANHGALPLKFNIINARTTGDGLYGYVTSNFVTLSSNYYQSNRLTRNYNISALQFTYRLATENIFFKDSPELPLIFYNLRAYQNASVKTTINFQVLSNYNNELGYISVYEDIGTITSLDAADHLITTIIPINEILSLLRPI